MRQKIKLIECPRDAMQGLSYFIPTDIKVQYLQKLLQVGFDSLDFGSFVSAKAIPQMADTHEVIQKLDLTNSTTKLLAIVANRRGAEETLEYPSIRNLGFPFSISETFQIRNTNSTILQSKDRVRSILDLCVKSNKELIIYLSMAFGNPYGDEWNADILSKYIYELGEFGCKIFALSDTIGVANPESIYYVFENILPSFPEFEIGAHFHTTPTAWRNKIEAACLAGCTRFDGAIRGFGGCPMAKDELTGNMATENLVEFFSNDKFNTGIDQQLFQNAMQYSSQVFKNHFE